MKKILITVLLFLFFQKNQIGQTGFPFIYNYGSDDYQAGIQNWDITQDADGRIYIANNFGLLIYDGSHWQKVNSADGTKLRTVLALDDKVYAGYQKDFGYYQANKSGQLSYISLADSLPSQFRDFDEIWKVYAQDEAIYFCGFDNIFKYQNGQVDVIESPFDLEISFQTQGMIYTQEWQKGLSVINGNEFELIAGADFFAEKRISGLLPFDRNRLLIATFNNGLFLYQNGTITPYEPLENISFSEQINNVLLRLKNGKIAIGTQNDGVFIINREGGNYTHLNKSTGLNDNTVNALFEDQEGFLWLSMNNGLSRIAINSPFQMMDDRHGINGAGYVVNIFQGSHYVGTNNGLYRIAAGEAQLISGSEGQVYSLEVIDDRLFVGHHLGPMQLVGDRVRLLDDEKGAWTFRKVPDRDMYLLGTYSGINRIVPSNSGYTIDKVVGFEESSRIMEFNDKVLWVSQGYKGAFKLEFNEDYSEVISQKLYNSENGFPTDLQINVFKLGNELIFGSEGGLFSYDENSDSFVPIDAYNSLLGYENIYVDMDMDELGNIYYITSSQIGRMTEAGNQSFEKEEAIFNPIKRLWNDDLGNINALGANDIWIGGREGFILFDPTKNLNTTDDFKILFNKIELSGQQDSILFDGFGPLGSVPQDFRYRNNNLNFEYAATHFGSLDQLNYAWRMNGFSNEWSEWTSEERQSFTNIHEGSYTFEVKAKNIYGVESDSISYSFEIAPPIYRSTLAYSFYTIGTFVLILMAFRTLDKKYKKQNKQIIESKDALISQKEEEIKTVSEKSEEEIIRLKNEKLESELLMKNESLTSSAMNLIQKNQLLGQIKNTLKSVTEKEEVNKQELRRIIKSIEKDLSAGEEWQQFKQNFDEVHGQFITRLKQKYPDLTPQEVKFSAYLRMNLNTKEIANLLNISVRGVEIGRYRVRKKLGLERKDNLTDFILRF